MAKVRFMKKNIYKRLLRLCRGSEHQICWLLLKPRPH